MEYKSASEAVEVIESGQNVYIHSITGAPQALIHAMTARASELSQVNIFHMHTEGAAPYVEAIYRDAFNLNAFFIASNTRKAIQNGRGSYIPIFLSEIPTLFKQKIIPLDIALISVSPPDKHGFCSLGTAVGATKAAVQNASVVIAQINRFMPRSHGDGFIHLNNIDRWVQIDESIPEVIPAATGAVEQSIGKYVAELIDDRSCLQMGVGSIPNAVLESLYNHKDLGIHTELFSDGILPLYEQGIITGKYKKKHPGKIVSALSMGTRKLYDFIDDNPMVAMLESDYVNDTRVIRQNPKTIAINSAIEIDLTGQVCADSIGSKMYSGVGGQMDFIRGASLSEGGKAIITIPSTTKNGISRISSTLNLGAGVVTTRAHVQYIVTEYGIANLYGKTLKQRAAALINIAHPNHREQLEMQARVLFGTSFNKINYSLEFYLYL